MNQPTLARQRLQKPSIVSVCANGKPLNRHAARARSADAPFAPEMSTNPPVRCARTTFVSRPSPPNSEEADDAT
jgi:hypothetical protein